MISFRVSHDILYIPISIIKVSLFLFNHSSDIFIVSLYFPYISISVQFNIFNESLDICYGLVDFDILIVSFDVQINIYHYFINTNQ